MSAVTAVIVCLTILVILRRAEPLAHRLVALAEKRAERPAPLTADPMPAWAELYVQQESEGWAREQSKARLMEMYAESGGDWDKVGALIAQGGIR